MLSPCSGFVLLSMSAWARQDLQAQLFFEPFSDGRARHWAFFLDGNGMSLGQGKADFRICLGATDVWTLSNPGIDNDNATLARIDFMLVRF